MRNQKGYVAGYNGQLIVTCQQVIVGAMLSQQPVDRTLLHPLLDTCRQRLTEAGIRPQLRTGCVNPKWPRDGGARWPQLRCDATATRIGPRSGRGFPYGDGGWARCQRTGPATIGGWPYTP